MKLPTSVTIHREEVDAAEKIRIAAKGAQDAYCRLCALDDLAPVPALADLTREWVRETVAGKINSVKGTPSLPSATKAAIVAEWEKIQTLALQYASAATRALREYPALVWRQDEDGYPYPTNIDDLAAKIATHPVPTVAQKHADLVAAAQDAVAALRKFEAENGVRKIALESLLRFDAARLAESWALGSILVDVAAEADDPRAATWRKAREAQIL